MRRDYPVNEGVLPLYSTSWFRLHYIIEEKEGIQYIVATNDSLPEKYEPLEKEPAIIRPKRSVEWNSQPHIHLARLDTKKIDNIIDYANTWGLLGLWKCFDYKEWPWHGENSLYQDGKFGDKFSVHYINQLFKNRENSFYFHRYREPLPVFIRAANDFQNFFNLLDGTPDNKSEAQDIINRYIDECRPNTWYTTEPAEKWVDYWQTPSLLHTCFLLTWLNIMGGKKYQRCKHPRCGKIFIIARPNEEYCSTSCKTNAKRLRNYYRNKDTGGE